MSWWRARSPGARVAMIAVVAVVGLYVLVGALNGITGGGPGGTPSSSYATSSGGLAAWADLLAGQGHGVIRLRVNLDRGRIPAGATVVVMDAPLTGAEVSALRAVLGGGGRVVLGGELTAAAFDRLAGGRARWTGSGPTTARPTGVDAGTLLPGVAMVRGDGDGAWSSAGGGRPLLAGGHLAAAVALTASVGAGRVIALADPSPLSNHLLDQADNAALAVDLAGRAGAPVMFAEAGHGYGQRSGVDALPLGWQHAFWLTLLAVVVAMWAAGKRLGPADREGPALPPPRAAYAEALAATLARTGDRDAALAPLRAAARRALVRRAGVTPDTDDRELERAARASGAEAAVVTAVLGPVTTDDDVLALGRARAGLEDGR